MLMIKIYEGKMIDLESVDYMLGGFYSMSDEFRYILCRSLIKLPEQIVEFATDSIFWISSNDDIYAGAINLDIFKNTKWIVVLSECLKSESVETQEFYVAHEVAHCWLNHRSSISANLSDEEYLKQEDEADDQARTWLKESASAHTC